VSQEIDASDPAMQGMIEAVSQFCDVIEKEVLAD